MRFSGSTVAIVVACGITPSLADGILISWGPLDLKGMTQQRFEAAKNRSIEEILTANRTVRTWPEAYLCLVGANAHKEDKALLAGLVKQIDDIAERALEDTDRLIIWERIASGEILFEGKGLNVEDDVFLVAGRANWILRSITNKNFGFVKNKNEPEFLRHLQESWRRWLAGDSVSEFITPYASRVQGLEEIRSLAALEGLIVSLAPNDRKEKKTAECLRNLYQLEKLPTEPGAPGRLCSPDTWAQGYLLKVTTVTEEHDAAWWSRWWAENKSSLDWDPERARFIVAGSKAP